MGMLPNGWTDWHQIRYTSMNGHRLEIFRPTMPHGGMGGGVNNIQKPGKCGQTAGPIGNTFCTSNAGETRNGHMLNTMRHQGEHFDAGLSSGNVLGFKVVNISSKVWGMPRSQEKTN